MLTTVCLGHLRSASQCLRTQASRNLGISAVLWKKASADVDPIQQLFAHKAREYEQKQKAAGGGMVDSSAETQAELNMELTRIHKQFGVTDEASMSQFPKFKFTDEPVEVGSTKSEGQHGDLPF